MNKIIDFVINENIEAKSKIEEIEEQLKNNSQLSVNDIKSLLNYLSYTVRVKIAEYENTNILNYDYSFKCDLAQSMIYYYLSSLGVKVNPVNTNEVINGVIGHSLTLATFNTLDGEKTYLIDPTYIQFFSKEKCDANKFVIINNNVCITPDPGYFIVKDSKEKVVLPLLNNGYIEFNEEAAKAYGDSFYQTKTGMQLNNIKNNTASGSLYIKWFNSYSSKLSKSKEELEDMGVLIKPINEENSFKM